MPVVDALCLHDAFDSTRCFYYEQGKTYPIDTESDLARMTVRPLSSGRVDQKTGEVVPVKTRRVPLPVFQFDRAVPMGAYGSGKPYDYTCSQCGKKCKSLNELGNHVHSAHPKEEFQDGTEDEEAEVVIERRGAKKGRTFTCRVCGEVLPNLYAIRVHNRDAHKPSEVEAETETVPA